MFVAAAAVLVGVAEGGENTRLDTGGAGIFAGRNGVVSGAGGFDSRCWGSGSDGGRDSDATATGPDIGSGGGGAAAARDGVKPNGF